MRLRSLGLRPYRACRVSKSFQHTTVDAAHDMAHQVECSFNDETGTLNRRAIDFPWEKLEQSTSQTLSVGEDRSTRGGRFESATAAQASHAKVDSFESTPRPSLFAQHSCPCCGR